MANARKIAIKALIEVNRNGAYSNLAFNEAVSTADIKANDKALAAALFYGVLDRLITLDYIISKYIKTPVKKLSPITHEALRIAVYQILYMDKIPQSAAVNESVNIVKSSKERHNASFVNGVLRNMLRNPVTLPVDDSFTALSVRYSCPKGIISEFTDDYGSEVTENLLMQSLLKPPITLRVNTVKTDILKLASSLEKEGITTSEVEGFDALSVEGSIDVRASLAFKSGLFHIQDMASQISTSILNPKKGECVLDMCAAPGGKSYTMAQMMENNGELLAFDLYEKRVDIIAQGAKRLGLDIIKASVGDATVFNSDLGAFDAILCDVPCSGLGVIRRKPEIKYKGISDYLELEAIQSKILENAALYLKKGGRLLYSTCTLRKAENEHTVKTFLDKHTGYELKYERTFMPHIDGTDGFYCALITKSR